MGGDEFRTSLIQAQRDDSFCSPLIYYLESGDDTQLSRLPIPKAEFSLNDGILILTTYLESKHEPHREVSQVLIPESLLSTIIEALHPAPHAGHPGKDIRLHQARLEYYWPTMRKDIHSYIDKCHTCAVNKGSLEKPVKILSYPTPLEPWDTLATDLLKLPTSSEGHQYLLVTIDHFSRYSILVPLKDKTATTVATALIDNVFCPFNTPKTLLSDNGPEFNNSILSEICKQFDIKKTNIVASHPASNGLVERQNRKIMSPTITCW